MDAELQIDVNKKSMANSRLQDSRSFAVNLGQNVGTTAMVFEEALEHIREEASPKDKETFDYVQRDIYREPDIRHIKFVAEHLSMARALERRLVAPAVGGATIRHRNNREALYQAFKDMTAGLGLGPDNPLEVWIVASTSGGTGEGGHRFVGAYLAHFLSKQPGGEDTPITLNFIRIGQMTYRSVNPERMALNTFFGIAADSAFALKVGDDFPQVATNWFYVDVPDVGTGEQSVPVRAEIIEMAAKAIMLDELRDDLERLLVNNSGIPMVLVRTGYWNKGFRERRRYYETLRQLKAKLRDLADPDYEQKYLAEEGRHPPQFEGGEELEEWIDQVQERQYVSERIENGWQFPKCQEQALSHRLEEARELVSRWKKAMEELLNSDWGKLQAEFWVDRAPAIEGEKHYEVAPLQVSVEMDERKEQFGQKEWAVRLEEAHNALAWSQHLLGCDLQDGKLGCEGLFDDLYEQAKKLSRIQHRFRPSLGSTSRAQKMTEVLGKFLRELAKVDLLLAVERDAQLLLDRELDRVNPILKMAERECEAVRNVIGRERREFIEPDYEEKYIVGYEESPPKFSYCEILDQWDNQMQDAEYLSKRLEGGWRFPRYRPEILKNLADLRPLISDWKKSIERLLDVNWNEVQGKFLTNTTVSANGEETQEKRPLDSSTLAREKDRWFERVERCHYVRAWVLYLLGCDLQNGALEMGEGKGKIVESLLNQAREVSQVLYVFPISDLSQLWRHITHPFDQRDKAEQISGLLGEFVKTLAQVDHLLHLEDEAQQLIDQELQTIQGKIEGEQPSTIVAANLTDVLTPSTQTTWLQLLYTATRRGDRDLFKEQVLQGSTGLTKAGLRAVLNLRPRAEVTEVHDVLTSHMGQMYDNDGKPHEAPWWADISGVKGVLQDEYRILPCVSRRLERELESKTRDEQTQYRYVFTPGGVLKSRVLAFQGISLAKDMGDTVTAPAFLLEPFVPQVKRTLAKWKEESPWGTSPGRLAVVSAGVCCEPLYEPAMRIAGLDDEEIEKVEEYYTLL
jgi:hypothetical protein